MENERVAELEDKILKAQEDVGHLSKSVEDLKAHLAAERHGGAPNPDELNTIIQDAQKEMDDIQAEIDQAKATAKEHKRVLNELKQNYELLPDDQKPEAWQKLTAEVEYRGTEINENNTKIDVLETHKMAVLGRIAMAKHKLEALNAGVFSLPVEEDPRLKWTEDAYQKAVESLEGYKKELTEAVEAAKSQEGE